MAKTPAYIITTVDDARVDARTEGKAADKRARQLTEETGIVHRVYTPTGKLRLETEVIEDVQALDDVPAVDIHEDLYDAEGAEVVEDEEPAAEVEDVQDADADEPAEEADDAEDVQDEPAEDEAQDAAEEDEPAEVEETEEEKEEVVITPAMSLSYATLQTQLTDDDPDVRAAAKTEWQRRLDIYKLATRAKDPAERIPGPAMAAALEMGTTQDGRTRAALVKRGLAEKGEDGTFTVTDAGRKALAAAVKAVAV